MKFLPWHDFEIMSALKPQAAIDALSAITEPVKMFRLSGPGGALRFQGSITGMTFSVTRIIGYRNSFLPQVTGEVALGGIASLIKIRMRLHPIVYLFAALFGAVALGLVATVSEVSLIGLGMFAFLYLMTMGGFWFEASKQEKALRELFKAIGS